MEWIMIVDKGELSNDSRREWWYKRLRYKSDYDRDV